MKKIPAVLFFGLLACICLVFSTCQKELSIETNVSLAAQGTLRDTTTGECMPDSVVGTYYDGVEPGRDTAFVLVNVTVTNAGTYNIYTNTVNGYYFSDSGFFTTPGINTIKLKPVGTPIIPGTNTFNVTFDTSICSFTVNVEDSTGKGIGVIPNPNFSDTAWKFTSATGSFKGPIDSAFTNDTTISGIPLHIMTLLGTTLATGDTLVQISVGFTGGVITTGSFNTTATALFRFTDQVTGTVIYAADPTTGTVNTVINITSYDAATNIVTGTYSGTAQDSSGNPATISGGTFKAKVQ